MAKRARWQPEKLHGHNRQAAKSLGRTLRLPSLGNLATAFLATLRNYKEAQCLAGGPVDECHSPPFFVLVAKHSADFWSTM
jgi:hypothetical protein